MTGPRGARSRAPRGTAKDRALGLLAVRWRSRQELERRLLQAGFQAEDVRSTVDGLLDAGLVDDDRFARELVRSHVTTRLSGDRAIKAALRQRGVSEVVQEQALRGAGEETERAAALASRRAPRMRGLSPEVAFRRLHGLLMRRGYGPGIARQAAREALQEVFGPVEEPDVDA
ncbi:MAG: regulatory protein RecX [Actinobacteria bacterium]|nr:regulatory protein RecX [Actinomycetota bacterium]